MTNPAEKTEGAPALIFGLGNPGPGHRFDRHNAGFTFIDRLIGYARFASMGIKPDMHAFGALVFLEEVKLLLIKPLNYMNRSGDVVRRMLAFRKLPTQRMLLVHDDLDLPPGAARLKFGGGHGGHQGLRNVIEHCGEDFLRLRLGVGRPGKTAPGPSDPGPADTRSITRYVLSRPPPHEEDALESAMEASLKALSTLYTRGLQAAMNELHAPPGAPQAPQPPKPRPPRPNA